MGNERAMLKLIEERDAAEEALSQAYAIVMGEGPNWSNLFGYQDALNQIERRVNPKT